MTPKQENAELKAHVNSLREALQFYSDCNHFDNASDGSISIADHGEVADEALSTPSTDILKEHDAKVIAEFRGRCERKVIHQTIGSQWEELYTLPNDDKGE